MADAGRPPRNAVVGIDKVAAEAGICLLDVMPQARQGRKFARAKGLSESPAKLGHACQMVDQLVPRAGHPGRVGKQLRW